MINFAFAERGKSIQLCSVTCFVIEFKLLHVVAWFILTSETANGKGPCKITTQCGHQVEKFINRCKMHLLLLKIREDLFVWQNIGWIAEHRFFDAQRAVCYGAKRLYGPHFKIWIPWAGIQDTLKPSINIASFATPLLTWFSCLLTVQVWLWYDRSLVMGNVLCHS